MHCATLAVPSMGVALRPPRRCPSVTLGQGETVHRLTHALGQLGQLADAARGGGRTGRGLRGDLADHVHRVGNVAGGGRLLARRVGDVLDQRRQAGGYLFDLLQGHTRILGQAGTADHLGGGLLHRDDRFVGIGLNGLHQRLDLLGGRRGTFRQTLYLVRYHREATTGITSHRRLDGGVQRQNVGLVGNVVDQADDVTDLLGGFTQTLDPLGGVLDLLTDHVHAGDGALYHLVALVGDGYRTFRYRGGLGGVGRYLVNGHGHLVHRGGGTGDFLGLVLGRLGQVHGRALGFLRRLGHLQCGVVDGLYQGTQLVDGVVDGVRDGTGEVLGHRRFGCQVTVREVGDLVQQSQNRRLVTLVGGSGFSQTLAGVAGQLQADEQNAAQGDQAQQIAQQGVEPAAVGTFLEGLGQGGHVVQQLLRVGEDVVGRTSYLIQLGGGEQDLFNRFGHIAEQVGDLLQTAHRIGVGNPGHAQYLVAVQHAIEHPTEQGSVATEAVGRHDRILVTGQYPVHRAENPLGQQRLTLGHGNLMGGGTALDQHVHHVLVLDLQLRHGIGQLSGHIVQRQYRLLTAQDGVGVVAQLLPVGTGGGQFIRQGAGCRRQPGFLSTVGQIAPALLVIVARLQQQREGLAGAGCRFGRRLGDLLGQYPQLARVTDIFGIVGTLHVHIQEVDEQQDQRDNQRDKQATDGPVAAQSREDAGGVKIFHFLGPYLAYRMLLEVLKCCAPATAGPPPSDQTATSRNAWSRANARKLNIIDTCSPV